MYKSLGRAIKAKLEARVDRDTRYTWTRFSDRDFGFANPTICEVLTDFSST